MADRRINWTFFAAVAGGLSAGALGASNLGTMHVRIPPTLAADLLQQGLGREGPSGTSRVHFDIAKPIEAEVKNVKIKSLSEIMKVYPSALFPLDLSRPFDIPIKVFGLSFGGDFRVTGARFNNSPDSDGDRFGVTVDIAITRLDVRAGEVWAKEVGLVSSDEATTPETTCGTGSSGDAALDRFAGRHVWARVSNAALAPRSSKPEAVVAHARFGVRLRESAGPDGRIELVPDKVDIDNLEEVVRKSYAFRQDLDESGRRFTRLEVPTVRVWTRNINGVGRCREGEDLQKGAQALFDTFLAVLKTEIVHGVRADVAKEALKAAQKELGKLELPAGKEFVYRATRFDMRRPPAPLSAKDASGSADRHWSALLSAGGQSRSTDARRPLLGVLWEIRERLGLNGFRVAEDGALELGLSEDLRVNGRIQPSLTPNELGTLPAQEPKQIRIVLNRAFFEQKADLIESMKDEQRIKFPEGISLGAAGIAFEKDKSGRIGVVAQLDFDLKVYDGWKGLALRLGSRLAAIPNGILSVTARATVKPETVWVDGVHKLWITFDLDEDSVMNAIRQHPRLDSIYDAMTEFFPKAASRITGKLHEAAERLRDKPIEVALDPLESKTPLHVERVRFTDQGALVVDLSVHDFRPFVKRDKAKSARGGGGP